MDLNKAMLIGRLGKDPEIKHVSDDQNVANFSVATSEVWFNKKKEKQERTTWHNIVAWRKLADVAEKYLVKGKQVFIEGKIVNRSYDDKEGIKKYVSEIHATQIIMLGSKKENGGNGSNEKIETAAPTEDATEDPPVNQEAVDTPTDENTPF